MGIALTAIVSGMILFAATLIFGLVTLSNSVTNAELGPEDNDDD